MKIINILLSIVLLLLLSACGGASSYYVLSLASHPQQTYQKKAMVIGVEKVTVPAYLYKREIAVATSSSQIRFLSNATWGEDLDTGLTNRLVGFLQKKFNQPNVFIYPWGLDKQPNIVVSVQVTRFIAQEGEVYLDATWNLKNLKTHKEKAQLFSTSIATTSDAKSIVSAMDKALGMFEETVSQGILHF